MTEKVFFDFETEEGKNYPITIVVTEKKTKRVIDRIETKAYVLDGAITTMSIMYNALSVAGGVCWRHPGTGEHYPNGISYYFEFVHPETGEIVSAT